LLEERFECLLVNARHVKQVPGRKTDCADAAWLCQLLECGLLRGSFVPPKPIRALRTTTRYRKALIQERQREANRLHKVLEDTGIKLDCVATDILGVSGRLMLEALCQGTTDPQLLAELARGKLVGCQYSGHAGFAGRSRASNFRLRPGRGVTRRRPE
jgi:transposase